MPKNPFYIQPASGLSGFKALQEGIGKRVEYERGKVEEAQKMKKRQEAGDIINRGDPEEVSKFMIENPDIAEEMRKTMKFKDETTEKNFIEESIKVITGEKTPLQGSIDRGEVVLEQGGDIAETLQYGAVAKAEQDETGSQEESRKFLENRFAAMYPKKYEALMKSMGRGIEKPEVGAREILEDGTIIQSTPQGPVVWSPTGERLKGQAAADQIKIARAEKVSNLRKAAGEKKRASLEAEGDLKAQVEAGIIDAKEAAKISVKAFSRLEKINEMITTIDESITALDEGAKSGVIESRLPSIRAASVKLDNLQKRLGLNVIQNTTFGSLSTAELNMALSTAMPTGLSEPDLRKWLVDKKASQEKLSDYIEASAIFLGTNDETTGKRHTVAQWMQKQRDKRNKPQYTEGQTATGPNGEKVIFRNGQWEAM
jgi:hypothetical protein